MNPQVADTGVVRFAANVTGVMTLFGEGWIELSSREFKWRGVRLGPLGGKVIRFDLSDVRRCELVGTEVWGQSVRLFVNHHWYEFEARSSLFGVFLSEVLSWLPLARAIRGGARSSELYSALQARIAEQAEPRTR